MIENEVEIRITIKKNDDIIIWIKKEKFNWKSRMKKKNMNKEWRTWK